MSNYYKQDMVTDGERSNSNNHTQERVQSEITFNESGYGVILRADMKEVYTFEH